MRVIDKKTIVENCDIAERQWRKSPIHYPEMDEPQTYEWSRDELAIAPDRECR